MHTSLRKLTVEKRRADLADHVEGADEGVDDVRRRIEGRHSGFRRIEGRDIFSVLSLDLFRHRFGVDGPFVVRRQR